MELVEEHFKMNSQQHHHTQQHFLMTPNENKLTPKNSAKCGGFRKSINPRSPKAQSLSYSVMTCNSMMSQNGNGNIHSVSMSVIQTPPAKRYQKIKNPFETALAERLHLPIIGSPSLFQCAEVPQMSSTQCEWTIDEVSSMMPANVEPHETQFTDTPDPELEAKAQMAISSYFKEQQIVPSPVDCPLRSHRIVLNDLSGHTPLSKPGRRIRDCASQTELSLPPILPPALEEALKPYFQPHLAGTNTKELRKNRYGHISCNSSGSSVDSKDISLRRKLFDIHNVLIWENDHPSNRNEKTNGASNGLGHINSSPISLKSLHTPIVGKLSDSLDKSSFGSLSPISAADDLSPAGGENGSATKRKSRFENLRNELEDLEQLSPIHPPVRRKPLMDKEKTKMYRSHNKENMSSYLMNSQDVTLDEEEDHEKFSPERSSSPLTTLSSRNIGNFSTDSFNIKVSRLKVNSSKCSSTRERIIKNIKNQSNGLLQDPDIFMCHEENTEDVLECTGGDLEDMQMSQMSTQSSNCSSSQSDTPRGKRRSASRKNLSRSFSANWLNENESEEEKLKKETVKTNGKIEKESVRKLQFNAPSHTGWTVAPTYSSSFGGVIHHNTPMQENSPRKTSLTFYRTDSGFNEMSQNSSGSQDCPTSSTSSQPNSDIHMCCSSTPSTKDNNNFDFII